MQGTLKHNVSSYHDLVQWMELNRMFGAEHTFIYNYDGGEALLSYLEHYERQVDKILV